MTTAGWVQWKECDFQPRAASLGILSTMTWESGVCEEALRNELETPNAVEANDGRVQAPVPVLETTLLTRGSTSPTAWRWRSRVWSPS